MILPFYLNALDVEKLISPEGFETTLFVSDIESPRQIAEGQNGYIFVGSKKGGYALRIMIIMAKLIELRLFLRVLMTLQVWHSTRLSLHS